MSIFGCFFKHKWDRWSEPKEGVFYRKINGVIVDNNFVAVCQYRTCERCGESQWRFV